MINSFNPIEGIGLKPSLCSVYDMPEDTMNELLSRIVELCNKLYKEMSEYESSVSKEIKEMKDKIEYLLNQGLTNEVLLQLEKWKNDGTLASIINESLFSQLNIKIQGNTDNITSLTQELTNKITQVTELINNQAIEIRKEIDGKITQVNGNISSLDKKLSVSKFIVANDGDDISDQLINLIKSNPSSWRERGIKIVIPQGQFIITKQIDITKADIWIEGQGKDITVLVFKGDGDCMFNLRGQSGGKWLNGIHISDLSIKGFDGNNADGLRMQQVGLNSYIGDIGIYDFGGIGIKTHSCFDMNFSNIEVRKCRSYGVLNLEQNELNFPSLPFEETSYLRFDDVIVVACNTGGVQWEIRGGNSYFLRNCKPNEGTIGINIKNRVTRSFIDMLYYDGVKGNSIAINIEDSSCREITINSLSTWNANIAVKARGTKALKIGDCFEGYTDKSFSVFDIQDCKNVYYYGTSWNNYKFQNSPVAVPVMFGGRYKENVLQNAVGLQIYSEYRSFTFTQGSNLQHFKIDRPNYEILEMIPCLVNFGGLVTNPEGKNIGLIPSVQQKDDGWWVEIRLADMSTSVYTNTEVTFKIIMFCFDNRNM